MIFRELDKDEVESLPEEALQVKPGEGDHVVGCIDDEGKPISAFVLGGAVHVESVYLDQHLRGNQKVRDIMWQELRYWLAKKGVKNFVSTVMDERGYKLAQEEGGEPSGWMFVFKTE